MKKLLAAMLLLALGLFAGLKLGGGDTQVVLSSGPSIAVDQASATLGMQYTGAVHEVRSGASIQAAVKRAQPGDTVLVFPGTYKETVYIDKDNIRLAGVIVKGEWPVLEGEGKRNDAVLYSGSGITVENLKITHYKGNGIMGQAGNNFVIRNNWIDDTGVYGIFPQLGKNGLVEYNVLRGIEDAAIYVGMSDMVVVRHNEVFENVAGIEIENTRHALVEHNLVYNNSGGILAFVTPGLPIKTTEDVVIRNNFVVGNNHENFAQPGSIVSFVPAGTGIINMAADDVIIENNIIRDNQVGGIVVATLDFISEVASDSESDPTPERLQIYNNFMDHNGYNTIDEIKVLMTAQLKGGGADIVDIGSKDSCITNAGAYQFIALVDYSPCAQHSSAHLDPSRYLSATPVATRQREDYKLGKIAYYGICAGCHAYNIRMIGPPTQVIQALYMENPQGLADYIFAPHKVRDDYPPMPPQDYLDESTRLAVAKYVLEMSDQE